MSRLATKVAIVTGASGIGLGIAHLFVKEGAKVVFSDINKSGKAAADTAGKNAIFIECDIFIQSQSRIWLQKQFRPLAQLIF